MIQEIQARTLISPVKQPDTWFGLTYNMNLYRGCQHHCIYCDSRSQCYGIEDFDGSVLVKVNAPELLEKELSPRRKVGTIGTGSMNDPYMPCEAELGLTRRALAVIARRGFPVHVITKSKLVVRDLPLLQEISRTYAAVSFTITTPQDELARKIEPGAALPSERYDAMAALSAGGILIGVTLMPVLPFLEDQEDQIRILVRRAAEAGARYILPAFSVTLRDRQREYFYNRLDRLFPGIRARYEFTYGERYGCVSPNVRRLQKVVETECDRLHLAQQMPVFTASERQLRLF